MALVLGGILLAPDLARGQAPTEIPGSDAVFAGRGVALAWGLLRGAEDAAATAVVWVTSRDSTVQAVSVDLVNPVTGKRLDVLAPSIIGKGREVRIPRASVTAYPRAEFRFAGGTEILASGAAAFTVFFTGIPERTPEFSGETALAEHLEAALAQATGR